MALVISDMSMSLDGFVTGPNADRENPFGDGAESLHEWLSDAATDDDRALLEDAVEGTGAIVMGRKSFDDCVDAWGDRGPVNGTPCFVVTHHAPTKPYPPVYTFVTDGVPAAIELAEKTAGDKVVGLHGATVLQQGLPLGLVDGLVVHVMPLLVGGGTRLFDVLGSAIKLERTDVIVTPTATHLRYRVL